MDEKPSPDWLRNLPTRSDDIGFAPEDLRKCDACGKPNAPNRVACLYCGAEFAGAPRRLEIREVESWENGFNVVLTGVSDVDVDQVANSLASTLGVESSVLLSLLGSGKSLPIARLESDELATAIGRSLEELGIASRVVSDELLAVATPHVRLRSITFHGEELKLNNFNSDESVVLDRGELALIVSGVAYESRTEAMEQRKRGATKRLSESQTSQDQSFIDLYSRGNAIGWRIPSSGFDFSSLGDEKSLLVGENLGRLVTKLTAFAPDAKLVDDYLDVRALLEHIWPSEHRREVFGFQRSSFARKDLSSQTTSNNATQVSKYSRLQWHLL